MRYCINGRTVEYISEGERSVGESIILSQQGVDLTHNLSWHNEGYCIYKLFDTEDEHLNFSNEAKGLLVNKWKGAGLNIIHQLLLEGYHKFAANQELHLNAIGRTKLLSVEEFPMGIKWLEERISDFVRKPLHVHNPFDNQDIFHFRVIRPNSGDNNPLHRDVWLEDYADCINLYIPIAGSDEKSSLILVPGSHLWPESKIEKTKAGAIINGQKFNVPAVTNILEPFEMIRPNPKSGEVLIFSPYLIHGGAVNLNADRTRISIEVRLWPKKN